MAGRVLVRLAFPIGFDDGRIVRVQQDLHLIVRHGCDREDPVDGEPADVATGADGDVPEFHAQRVVVGAPGILQRARNRAALFTLKFRRKLLHG